MTDYRTWSTNNTNLTYRVNNGNPQSVDGVGLAVHQQRGMRGFQRRVLGRSSGPWAASRWQGALRFDRATSWFPTQQEGPVSIFSRRRSSCRPRAV